MTTQQTHTPFTEAEVADLASKLAAWARTLSPREQHILSAMLAAADAADRGEVEGYMMNLMDPREATGPTPLGSPTTVGSLIGLFGGAGSAGYSVGAAIDAAIENAISPYLP